MTRSCTLESLDGLFRVFLKNGEEVKINGKSHPTQLIVVLQHHSLNFSRPRILFAQLGYSRWHTLFYRKNYAVPSSRRCT
jgi:hypothetical protein